MTLIEIMIVVAILAIAALLVMPGASENDTTCVRSAARLLIADIEHAQIESMGDGEDPLIIVFDTVNQGYHLARQSTPHTPALSPVTGDPYETRFGQGRAGALAGVIFDQIDVGGDDQLGFTAFGSLDQSIDAHVTLRCGSSTMRITIDAMTGEPRVE